MLYRAAEPLPARTADRKLTRGADRQHGDLSMGRSMPRRRRRMSRSKRGERVEIELVNQTQMSHPMHLHGHHFQVVAVNGAPLSGAVRDTVLVPVGGSVTIAFDAGNPGRWMFHCHNLYHMASGMMTEVAYL